MDADQGSRQRATKKLFVLRHAKSSWDDPGIVDHDRPLAPRGHRATEVLAEYVRANEVEPELVLCSSARRTRETLEGVAPAGRWVIEEGLYGAEVDTVLERLRQVPEGTASVMVIGHNPAMQDLVLRLGNPGEAAVEVADIDEVRRKFPTGALATLTFDCGWGELSSGCARLSSVVRPKQLLRA